MKLLIQIVQALRGNRAQCPETTEYVPYETFDWRGPLLLEAARKHGKPFKCAGDDLPREIILGGKRLVVVGLQEQPIPVIDPVALPQYERARSVFALLTSSAVLTEHRRRQVELRGALHEAQA